MSAAPPAGHENLPTPAALAIRLRCSVRHAGLLFISGAVRPDVARHDGAFYRTEYLDRLRDFPAETLAETRPFLTLEQRTVLAAGLPGLRQRLRARP